MRVSSVVLARLRTQIQQFKKQGVVFDVKKEGTAQIQRNKVPEAFKANSLNKCVQILRNQYDGLLFDENNKVIDTTKITSRDLKSDNKRGFNLVIFKNLMKLKQKHKKPIDRNLLLILLGIQLKNLNDKVKVTEQVTKLMNQDKSPERARYLLKLSYHKNVVAMNKLIQGILQNFQEHTDYRKMAYNTKVQIADDALMILNDSKKWGYTPNEQTYAILFGGLSRVFGFGEVSSSLSRRLVNVYDNIETPSVTIFNALLSCLIRDTTNDQYYAWDMFNKIDDAFKPNVQSFTIFLNGLVSYNEQKVDLVKKSSKPKITKSVEIYQLNNQLVDLGKVIAEKAGSKIDAFFVAQYISCLINQSYSDIYGHNYSSAGLQQMCQWVPEIGEFAKKHELNLNTSKAAQVRDDYRFRKVVKEYVPAPGTEFDVQEVEEREIDIIATTPKIEVNKVLLYKFVQGLAQLDRPIQFISSVWKILSDFAGIEFEKYPSVKKGQYDVAVKLGDDVDPHMAMVDSRLIDNFVYTLSKMFNKEMKSSILCLNVVRYAQVKRGLVNPSSYHNLLSIIDEEINHLTRSNKSKDDAKRYKRDILSNEQLDYLTQCLQLFATIAPDSYTDRLQKLVDKISKCSWYEVKGQAKAEHYKTMLAEALKTYKNKGISISSKVHE